MPDNQGRARSFKRRLASGRACNNCRARKNRCDGIHPHCSSCKCRGIPCRYPDSAASELTYEEIKALYVEARASRQASTPRSRDDLAIGQRQHSGQGEWPSISTDATELDQGTVHTSQPTETTEDTVPANLSSRSSSPSESREPNGYFGGSSTFAFVSEASSRPLRSNGYDIRDRGQTPRSTAWEAARSTIHSGASNIELPDRQVADSLVDAYFSHVHPLYPFVHEPSFRIEYERVWTMSMHARNPTDEIWLGLLNLILAYGCEFLNTTSLPHDPIAYASSFLNRSRALIVPYIFGPGSLGLVQALLLMCHYLQGTLELDECWNLMGVMIRMALGIGLHLNHTDSSLSSVVKEMRKRIWWGCVVLDKTLSMKFGRPPSITQLDEMDVNVPLNVDDQYITDDLATPRQPIGRPSLTHFFTQTIKQIKVMDRILHDLYLSTRRKKDATDTSERLEKHSESHILCHTVALDEQLLFWWRGVPQHLKQPPDPLDGSSFQRQRNVILIRFLNLRLLLHRQSFLVFCRQDIEDQFQKAIAIASAQVCVDAAVTTIKSVHAHHRLGLTNPIWYNLHYTFTAMGVLLLLQKVNSSKRNALKLADEDIALEYGIEFLKAARSKSALAGRYLALLQRLQNGENSYSEGTVHPQGRNNSDGFVREEMHIAQMPSLSQNYVMGENGEQNGFQATFDQQGLDPFSLDFESMLYGFAFPWVPGSGFDQSQDI